MKRANGFVLLLALIAVVGSAVYSNSQTKDENKQSTKARGRPVGVREPSVLAGQSTISGCLQV